MSATAVLVKLVKETLDVKDSNNLNAQIEFLIKELNSNSYNSYSIADKKESVKEALSDGLLIESFSVNQHLDLINYINSRIGK